MASSSPSILFAWRTEQFINPRYFSTTTSSAFLRLASSVLLVIIDAVLTWVSHYSASPSILAPQSSQCFLVGLSQLPSVVMTKPHAEQHHSSPPRCAHRPCTTGTTSAAGVRRTMLRTSFLAVAIVTAAFSSSGASGCTNESAASRSMYSAIAHTPASRSVSCRKLSCCRRSSIVRSCFATVPENCSAFFCSWQ